jgi:hypothetical protein
MNELGGVDVGKKPFINQKLVAWKVRGSTGHLFFLQPLLVGFETINKQIV